MGSRGVNRAIVLGNLGADPDTRYTAGGTAVTNINVATSETWKDKNSGEQQEKTEWHRVVFFARLAEIAGEYLRKGSKIYVEGRIQTRKWQNKDGQDVYTTEIVANEMQMLDSKGSNNTQEGSSRTQYEQQSQGGLQPQGGGGGFSDDLDDEIPFASVPNWVI